MGKGKELDAITARLAAVMCRELDCINYDSEVEGGCSRCVNDAGTYLAPVVADLIADEREAVKNQAGDVIDRTLESYDRQVAYHREFRQRIEALDPCEGADEQHDRHVAVCVPWYELRRALLDGETDAEGRYHPEDDRQAEW